MSDEPTWQQRASSFGPVAAAYERARPLYPAELVAWLAPQPPRDVLDLAAGTGKLTRQLVAAGHRVVAVEPSDGMREQLIAAVPGATALAGAAEDIPLADASVDAICVGQAWHWFDERAAAAECARVLRPGGTLGIVWNVRVDRDPWMVRLSEEIGAEGSGDDDEDELLAGSPAFGPVEELRAPHEHVVDRAGLQDLVASRSSVATRDAAGRARVAALVDELYDQAGGPAGITVTYATYAYRARRL